MCINDSDNSYSESWWNYPYRAIANANLAITHIPNIEMDATEKSKCLGEAYFLRAYNYFNLVRLFGSVPVVLVPVDASSPELYPQQASVESIYAQIVNDLQEAEKSSLPWTDSSGRVTMAAIKSVLAQVYMTMAGYPLQAGSEYYELAAAKAKEVIDSGACSLFTSYDDLHSEAMENQKEHILMIQYKSSVVANGFQTVYLPYNLDISYYSTEDGGIYALDEFIDTYEEGDKRTEEKAFYYTKYTSNTDRTKEVNFGSYYIYKFFDTDANLNTAQSSLNYPLLRYADILLLYLEAKVKAGEVINQTLLDATINKVRGRESVNMPPITETNSADLMKIIQKERMIELAFEGWRLWDLYRWGIAEERLNMDIYGSPFYVSNQDLMKKKDGVRDPWDRWYVNTRSFVSGQEVWPIPLAEKNINPNLR